MFAQTYYRRDLPFVRILPQHAIVDIINLIVTAKVSIGMLVEI